MFVDDNTHASWVYLLCGRSKVVTIVTHFIMEVVTQYSTTLKILRDDNTLKFIGTSLHTFLINRHMIHQTTCPHTSHQNGVVERKHRQLIDITCTLLIEMHGNGSNQCHHQLHTDSCQNKVQTYQLNENNLN